MAEHFIEVELRYKVREPQQTMSAMSDMGIVTARREHLIDQWFMPKGIKSLDEEKEWFDEQHGVAWRVRRIEQSDGQFAIKVDSKQLTDANNHNTFKEGTAKVKDYQDALRLMAEKKYYNWLIIDKTRFSFVSQRDDLEIVLDEIEGMAEAIGVGACLEIEYKGKLPRDEALHLLHDFAAQLGLDSDDLFEKSLTVEAMTALAKFEE